MKNESHNAYLSNSKLHNTKFLVINVSRIGDTILSTPLLKAIKHSIPKAQLTCAAHPKRAEILRNLDFVDELLSFSKKTAWLYLRKRWDVAFVLGGDEKLVRFALRTSKRVIAFKQNNIELNKALYAAVNKPDNPIHAVKERLLLADAAGINYDDLSLSYRTTKKEDQAAQHWLSKHTPAGAWPIIGLQMSSFKTKAYRDWPTEYFIGLARLVKTTYPQAYFIILGGRDDLAKAHQFHQSLPSCSTLAACGTLSLRKTASIINQLNLYIGVDTGPTHIAGALSTPMVALYHCFHPGYLLAPLQRRAPLIIIEHPLSTNDCSRTSPMSMISIENVWRAVKTLIDGQTK